jgi:hypothetical protein
MTCTDASRRPPPPIRRLSPDGYVGCAGEQSFDLPLSQDGDLLGLSAPHVNRMLHQLKLEELLSPDRHRVTIEDPEGLRLLAQLEPFSPLIRASSPARLTNEADSSRLCASRFDVSDLLSPCEAHWRIRRLDRLRQTGS